MSRVALLFIWDNRALMTTSACLYVYVYICILYLFIVYLYTVAARPRVFWHKCRERKIDGRVDSPKSHVPKLKRLLGFPSIYNSFFRFPWSSNNSYRCSIAEIHQCFSTYYCTH